MQEFSPWDVTCFSFLEANRDVLIEHLQHPLININTPSNGGFVARVVVLFLLEAGVWSVCNGLTPSAAEEFISEELRKELPRSERRKFLQTDRAENESKRTEFARVLSEWKDTFSAKILRESVWRMDAWNVYGVVQTIRSELSVLLQKFPSIFKNSAHIQETIEAIFPVEESQMLPFLAFLEDPSSENFSELTKSRVASVLWTGKCIQGHFVGISEVFLFELAYTFSKFAKITASNGETQKNLATAVEENAKLLRELRKALRQGEEAQNARTSSQTLLLQSRSENSLLRRDKVELSTALQAAHTEMAILQSQLWTSHGNTADVDLIAYAESVEHELREVRQTLRTSESLAAERLERILFLESKLASTQWETFTSRNSLDFMKGVEAAPLLASGDDLVKYLALSSVDISIKTLVVGEIIAFFDRFLLTVSKGACSSSNVNNAQTWAAWGQFANYLVTPLFNYLKNRAKSIHPQRFLDELCLMEWWGMLDSYSGGSSGTEMRNSKDRITSIARSAFRNDNVRTLPIFSAMHHFANVLDSIEVGNIDLNRLSTNIRRAIEGDPITRRLREITLQTFPTRVS